MKEDFNIALNKELLAEMPLVEFDGEITVADTPEAAREALEYLSTQKTVGFDTPISAKARTTGWHSYRSPPKRARFFSASAP